jgi:hypothetical protein
MQMKDPRKTLDLDHPLPKSEYPTLLGFALDPGITLITGLAMLSSVGCVLYPFDAGHNNRIVNGIVRAFLEKSIGKPRHGLFNGFLMLLLVMAVAKGEPTGDRHILLDFISKDPHGRRLNWNANWVVSRSSEFFP